MKDRLFRKFFILAVLLSGWVHGISQHQPIKYDAGSVTSVAVPVTNQKGKNYTVFSSERQIQMSEALLQETPIEFQQHPEFGEFVYKQVKDQYVELIHKRTENSRYFIDPRDKRKFYIQKSYGAMHYKNQLGWWVSIDPRLRAVKNSPGIYAAMNQPHPVMVDLNTGITSFTMPDGEIKFNKNLEVYVFSPKGRIDLGKVNVNTSNSTVGDEGTQSISVLNHMDREVTVDRGKIETDFILQKSLPELNGLPQDVSSFLVFEEVLDLPAGTQLIYDTRKGKSDLNGFWVGDLILINQSGDEIVRWEKPLIYDGKTKINGSYWIRTEGRKVRLSYLVDAGWLADKNRVFPIVIDPLVKTRTPRTGMMGFKNNSTCEFTYKDYCTDETPMGYKIDLDMPAKSEITEIQFLITANYSNPPSGMSKILFAFENKCARSPEDLNYFWGCDAGQGKGTCSTNQNGVEKPYDLKGGGSCIEASCQPQTVPFYFQPSGCACDGATETCPTSCQWVEDGKWIMLAEGMTIEPDVKHAAGTAKFFSVCQGEEISFTADAKYGVKPYSYLWTYPDGSTSGDAKITYKADVVGEFEFILSYNDACNSQNKPDTFKIKVKQSNEVILKDKKDVTCYGGNDGRIELEVKENVIKECGASTAGCAFERAIDVQFDNNGKSPASLNGRSPFQGSKRDFKVGFLYRKQELLDAGLQAGKITSLNIIVATKKSSKPFKQFNIKLACTPNDVLSRGDFDVANLTSVFGPKNYSTIEGDNTFILDNGYVWDGTSNLYIEFCYDNDLSDLGPDIVEGHNASASPRLAMYGEDNSDSGNGCKIAKGTTKISGASERLNINFGYCGGFLWSTGSIENKIENLKAGTYTVTYVDPIGCSFIKSYVITQPDKLEATLDPCPDASGNITIKVTGGIPDYEFSYDNGQTFEKNNVYNVSSLVAGSYTFKVRDANGCSIDVPYKVEDPIIMDLDIKQPCFIPGNDGQIKITASGGVPGYQYSVVKKGSQPNYKSNGIFSNLRPDVYIVSVKGSKGCPAGKEVELLMPKEIKVTVSKKDPCFGKTDGFIDITATGGTEKFEYSIKGDNSVNYTNQGKFQDLPAGTYNVIVRDDNGCKSKMEVVILKGPDAPLLFDPNPVVVQPSCIGKTDGKITFVGATGGVPPYEYSIDGSPFGKDLFFDNLGEKPSPKEYILVVRDAAGCTDEKQILIQAPPSIELDMDASKIVDKIKCFGDSSGYMLLKPINGNPPYVISVKKDGTDVNPETGNPNEFKNLAPGDYVFVISDTRGCSTIPVTITITQPDELILDAQVTKPNKCNNDAEITSVITGGTPPYEYTFDGVRSTVFVHSALVPKKYVIEVVDANLCKKTAELEIVALPGLEITKVDVTKPATCFDSGDAEVTITSTGGESPINYSKDGVSYQPANLLSGLSRGKNIVFAKDNKDCITTFEIDIPSPPQVVLKNSTNRTICAKKGAIMSVDLADADDLPSSGFTWENTPGVTAIVNPQKGTFSTAGLQWGTYKVLHIVQTCTTEVTVTLMGIEVDQNVNLCDNQTKVTFDAPVPGGGSWETPGSNFVINSIDNEITVTNPKAGKYPMIYLLGNGCTETMMLNINPTPVANFEIQPYPDGIDYFLAEMEEVSFTDQSATGNASTYIWDFGDGQTLVGKDVKHTFKNEGEFKVSLRVISPDSCINDTSKSVNIKRYVDFELPNIITPNGDGVNDELVIPVVLDYDVEVWVLDRWGKKVFVYPNDGASWKATKDAVGVYFYQAILTNKISRKEVLKKGNISLVR